MRFHSVFTHDPISNLKNSTNEPHKVLKGLPLTVTQFRVKLRTQRHIFGSNKYLLLLKIYGKSVTLADSESVSKAQYIGKC